MRMNSQASLLNTTTSLRTRPPIETLAILEHGMSCYGVTRVTDTTRLDNIGIPVFAAIRPCAGVGSISVTSGKSMKPTEARVGALAEAFELASAAYRPGESALLHLTFDEYRDRAGYPIWSLPLRATELPALRRMPPHGLMTYVECERLGHTENGLLPASLVYFPYHSELGRDLYGTSTNGLASGNSFEEALLHGLLETIERDAVSFANLGRGTQPVKELNCPEAEQLCNAVRRAGLDLEIVHLPNEFGLPTFSAYLFDQPTSPGPVFVGHGTHLLKDIALVRACTEAVQSRLTHIHGARDDIIDYHDRWTTMTWPQRSAIIDGMRRRNATGPSIEYNDIPTYDTPVTLAAAIGLICDKLQRGGIEVVCVFRYPQLVSGLHALRVVVPFLEFYTPNRFRIGERLLAYANTRA